MPQASILTAVFSYNRPEHLANCLQSLADMYPDADVVVYDDKSPNPRVAEVARDFGIPIRVGAGGAGRHGGLYANMQRAYEDARAGGYDYLFSIQDDLQLVRPVDAKILAEIDAGFAWQEAIFCLNVEFSRTIWSGGETRYSLAAPDAEQVAHRDYADVSLFHVQRMIDADWSFDLETHMVVSGEKTLSLKAAEMGLRRYCIQTPFLMHVPFPDMFRNRLKMPRLSGLRKGIFRCEYMDEAAKERMDSRPEGEYAQWRDYLTVADTNWFDRWLLSTKHDAKILQ